MEKFLRETLSFQNDIGVNTSFDFITGRDFFNKKHDDCYNCNDENYDKSKLNTISSNDVSAKNDDTSKQNVDFTIKTTDTSNIHTFEELIETIKNFNGCDLKRHATNTVIFDGNQEAKIMLIGEAPGEKEDLQGKPFCGQSGQLLRQALNCINLNVNNLLITNTVYWRPPQNRKPTEEEIATCKPFLIKMIEIINPDVIILCGATAIEGILKSNQKMSEITGKFHITDINFGLSATKKFKVFPIYHPSFLLRQPSMKKTFWQHLLILQDELKNTNFYAV